MTRKSIKKGENEGIKYEKRINNILKEKGFQLKETTSAGASNKPDGYFWFKKKRYPLEIKQSIGDFGQVELHWEKSKGYFYSKTARNIEFRNYLEKNTNFLEKINSEWTNKPKKFTKTNFTEADRNWDLDHFKDIKEVIDISYIEQFYNLKTPPVHYIQIEKRGFFYLGNDIANLAVDRINGKPYLRARVKTRSTSNNKWGFLVAIKMPGIMSKKYDLEEIYDKKQKKKLCFPLPQGNHIERDKSKIDGYL